MNKFGVFITVLLASVSVLADEQAEQATNLTLASADVSGALSWTIDEPVMSNSARFEKNLEKKAEALNEQLNAELQKSLEEKLNRELQF